MRLARGHNVECCRGPGQRLARNTAMAQRRCDPLGFNSGMSVGYPFVDERRRTLVLADG